MPSNDLDIKFRLGSQPPYSKALILERFKSCLGRAAESTALSKQAGETGKALPSDVEPVKYVDPDKKM